jgi:SAM-dependent methyltransferase
MAAKVETGKSLVSQLQQRVKRFRIGEVDLVLKILYESLIDPEQRHDLGEYYTPDWLAARICDAAIDDPVSHRVLDPACGSGGFLFHAVRRFIVAARAAGVRPENLARQTVQRVVGMDIHPVAVIIARVTYLLALGRDVLETRRGDLSVPVYLGDALQWSVKSTLGHEELEVFVPPSKKDEAPTVLRFPVAVAEDPSLFDSVIAELLQASERGAPASAVEATLGRRGSIGEADLKTLIEAYRELRKLRMADRNHVWGYVARNITRPVWLSRSAGRFDRVIGNPPWLSFRDMSDEMQAKARAGMDSYDIWVGGRHATHQDLSGYFFARCADLYLHRGGRIAFLMPLAAMTRGQFEKFRTGSFRGATVTFTDAWVFDERVFELFKVPACALFAERTPLPGRIPDRVLGFAGILVHRNASAAEAQKRLIWAEEDAPSEASFQAATPYRSAFRQGATLVPRMLCYVQRRQTGRVGTGSRIPIESRRSPQEKQPWKNLASLTGAVEHEFLRPALLGESVAPYRVLDWPEAVIPFDGEALDAKGASARGYPGLSAWLAEAERLWDANSSHQITFIERINYWSELEAQFPAWEHEGCICSLRYDLCRHCSRIGVDDY